MSGIEAVLTKGLRHLDKEKMRKYDSYKIQNVQLITRQYGNRADFMFIIQYNDCIVEASLNNKKHFVEIVDSKSMIRRHLIRGYNERVFLAETSGNAEKI